MNRLLILTTIILMGCVSCNNNIPNHNNKGVTQQEWGMLADSSVIKLFTLTNSNGCMMKVTNYGGIITSLMVPDKNGQLMDVVLGYDSLQGYLDHSPYFGALIGRYGNRIAGGRFAIGKETYSLALNNGPNHLHGGIKGFDKVVWAVEEFSSDTAVGLKLHYLSKDGEEGYPGNLDVFITYTLTNDNSVIFEYNASTDKPCPVNLTQHSYFNLAGKSDILSHELLIAASRYTVVDSTLIPTGELKDVKGTAFDFTKSKPIGRNIKECGGNPVGYDHNFVLDTRSIDEPAIRVTSPETGISMEVFTDQPGVQFYSGNFLDGSLKGKNGVVYDQYDGFCLETQHFPDAPNQPHFPSTLLLPGKKYHSVSIYKFSNIK
jgi:aldose 1-epimerase